MVGALTESEAVCINVINGAHEAEARAVLDPLPHQECITYYEIPTNEPWCRDHGPIFLTRDADSKLTIVDWDYNAWGNKYPPFDFDDVVPTRVGEILDVPVFYPGMILEGGSIEVNGAGALLTTESCLLNPNRNPQCSREQIEQQLRDYLGAGEILWLGPGIAGDDTDGHIDDLARFIDPQTIVVGVEPDKKDPNYHILKENRQRVETLRDQDGQLFRVIEIPMPGVVQHDRQRLPATYLNFYFINKALLVPIYRHKTNDRIALDILQKNLPRHKVIGIDCVELIWGLGAIHCLTQQQPKF